MKCRKKIKEVQFTSDIASETDEWCSTTLKRKKIVPKRLLDSDLDDNEKSGLKSPSQLKNLLKKYETVSFKIFTLVAFKCCTDGIFNLTLSDKKVNF